MRSVFYDILFTVQHMHAFCLPHTLYTNVLTAFRFNYTLT